jgi:hypothetical protein
MLQTPRTFVGVELEDPSGDEGEASPRPRNFLRRWGLVTGSFVLSAALLLFAAARVLQMGVDSPQATDKVAEQNEVLLSETVSVPGQSRIREDPLAELLSSGPEFARCCKIAKSFNGTIPPHWQNWWSSSACAEKTWNVTLCDQAVTLTECCKAQKVFKVVPGSPKHFHSMPGSTLGWWKSSKCDELVSRNLSESLAAREHLRVPDTNSSNASSAPKLCQLALQADRAQEKAPITKADTCSPFFTPPEKPKSGPWERNGVALQDVCFSGEGPFHAFVIGDWGALWGYKAAPHLGHRKERGQGYVYPTDNQPQLRVADQMKARAPKSNPDYVLNVGDNFYWGGIDSICGKTDFAEMSTNQFQYFFEDIYNGEGLNGKSWLGVLGNHDYGGFKYNTAWDQIMGYTYNTKSSGRWMSPAQYYRSTVKYPDFSIDYYFLDTNVWDANPSWDTSPRNICGFHNGGGSWCPNGLNSTWICPTWFKNLWDEQKRWLDDVVPLSTADWRIVVTHFPPYFGKEDWIPLARKHEIDFVITGHRHSQFVRAVGDKPELIWPDWGAGAYKVGFTDFLDPTPWVVSGGGGGITSEHAPSVDGNDDQYGFMDLTLTKHYITVEAISHTGILRRAVNITHNYRTTTTTLTNTTTTTVTTVTTSSFNESEATVGGLPAILRDIEQEAQGAEREVEHLVRELHNGAGH